MGNTYKSYQDFVYLTLLYMGSRNSSPHRKNSNNLMPNVLQNNSNVILKIELLLFARIVLQPYENQTRQNHVYRV